MSLSANFDAVIILSWSDWETEPRANRYHYATRFAKELPVLFLQNQRPNAGEILVKESGIQNLDIVACSAPIEKNQVKDLKTLMRLRGFKQPLIWIYDHVNYWPLLEKLPKNFRVYHATEDYFSMADLSDRGFGMFLDRLKKTLGEIDLLVAVTNGVLDSIKVNGQFKGVGIVLENGCDYSYYAKIKEEYRGGAAETKNVVIYQGGVNDRLDYKLLQSVIQRMPEFEFRFFGRIVDCEAVQRLKNLNNVRMFGQAHPDVVAQEMLGATVGIIPFVQNKLIRNSLPLKAFEYIACGLPVVSIPICALEKIGSSEGEIIRLANTDDEFVAAIRRLALIRHNSDRLSRSDQLASLNSYDIRFKEVVSTILTSATTQRNSLVRLNIALLYDPASCHVATIREHIDSFRRYSDNSYTLLPATGILGNPGRLSDLIDLSIFDVVVLHYSVRISLPFHFADVFATALENFHGLKVLFIQDEYDSVECTRHWMDRLQFDLVYTCIPLAEREKVYPSSRYPATEFLSTLTGYVSDSNDMDRFVRPLAERKLAFVYRGRELPTIYGRLGHEKFIIGVEARRRADAMNLPVDVACDTESRIYGDGWYRFLSSGRAMLGTESGSNVFDFDGSLALEIERIKEKHPEISFEELWEQVLKPYDGHVRMNQISPKIFEAITLRTALVLFEGEYSHIVRPDEHFIALRKDFSNFKEVVAKVMDDNAIREMTERAFNDVIASGEYSYRKFVAGLDRDFRRRCLRRQERKQLYGAIYLADSNGLRQILPYLPLALPCAADIFENRESLVRINEALIPSGRSVISIVKIGVGAWGKQVLSRLAVSSLRATCQALKNHPKLLKIAFGIFGILPQRLQVMVMMKLRGW
jgi:glycosyltransferase involved in cell wall biosynthesis